MVRRLPSIRLVPAIATTSIKPRPLARPPLACMMMVSNVTSENENRYRRCGDSDRQAVEIEVFKKFPVLGFYRGLALCFTQTGRGKRAFHSYHTLLK